MTDTRTEEKIHLNGGLWKFSTERDRSSDHFELPFVFCSFFYKIFFRENKLIHSYEIRLKTRTIGDLEFAVEKVSQ